MGNIISRLKLYVDTKVENTKQGIQTRVDNTKNGIYTRVDNTKTAVKNKVNNTRTAINNKITNTKNGIYNKVHNTKTGITNRVTAVKNGVCNTVNRTSDGVYNGVNNVKNGIVGRITRSVNAVVDFKDRTVTKCRNGKDAVVTKCRNTKNAVVTKYTNSKNAVVTTYTNTRNGIVTRYTNSKNAVVSKYTNTRDGIKAKYRSARETWPTLSKMQKLKYILLFMLSLVILVLATLTAWDVYQGDYDRASERLYNVWAFLLWVLEKLWYATTVAVTYFLYGTKICLEYMWEGTKIGAAYAWAGTKIAAEHTWKWTKIGAQYTYIGMGIAWKYFALGCKITWEYFWFGVGVCFEYFLLACSVTMAYTWYAIKMSVYYSIEGSKIAAEYSVKGLKLSLEYGWYALREGSVRFVKYAFYFMTNFRVASKEAAVYLWDTSIYLFSCLMTGSYEGGILFWQGTKYSAVKSYLGAIELLRWVAIACVTLYESTLATVIAGWEWSIAAVQLVLHTIAFVTISMYEGTEFACVTLYEWTILSATTIAQWTVTSTEFLHVWSVYLLKTSSQGLYVGVNQYGLKWAGVATTSIGQGTYGLGTIIIKFLTDLCLYVGNFVYMAGYQIYNVFYIIFTFFYQVVTAIMRFIKVCTGGAGSGVTVMFGGLAWAMEETVLAYMYMLHKYNMYREILFVGFVVLMILYCTGLMRDRKRSFTEGKDSDSESESEDEEDGDSNANKHDKSSLVPSKKDLALPADVYEKMKKRIPSFTEGDDESKTPAEHIIQQLAEDLLPPTDDEDDFYLEQAVPDFMDSGSDPEPDPPSEYGTEEDQLPTEEDFDLRQSSVDETSNQRQDSESLDPATTYLDKHDSDDDNTLQEVENLGPGEAVGIMDTLDRDPSPVDADDEESASEGSDDDDIEERFNQRVEMIKQQKDSANEEQRYDRENS